MRCIECVSGASRTYKNALGVTTNVVRSELNGQSYLTVKKFLGNKVLSSYSHGKAAPKGGNLSFLQGFFYRMFLV
ncbi:hypothetical protein IKQ21_00425 [bacterium]|nr:hypothetical protein [bacterium]